ncbi:MAG: hypothetical protein WAR39_10360 [Prevotella sp.]
MKKEYIKPIIINIKTYNDNALLQSASLYDIGKSDSVENIADEDGPITGDDGNIWND